MSGHDGDDVTRRVLKSEAHLQRFESNGSPLPQPAGRQWTQHRPPEHLREFTPKSAPNLRSLTPASARSDSPQSARAGMPLSPMGGMPRRPASTTRMQRRADPLGSPAPLGGSLRDLHAAAAPAGGAAKGKRTPRRRAKMNWKLGNEIARGGFGTVFLGLNVESGELMAVKILNARQGSELESLKEEITLLERCDHPHIVRYFGAQVENNKATKKPEKLIIFMEYVPGGSVSSLLNKFGAFDEGLTRHYLAQVLQGLEYLHQNDIVHGDIKGANILVDQRGAIRLSDFGASRFVVRLIENGKVRETPTAKDGTPQTPLVGTVNFLAPEVARQVGFSRKADVWSLGITMLEMLTGTLPLSQFSSQQAALLHLATIKSRPEIPANLSAEAKDFLNLCLQVDPDKRASVDVLRRHPYITGAPDMAQELEPTQDNFLGADEPSSDGGTQGSPSPSPVGTRTPSRAAVAVQSKRAAPAAAAATAPAAAEPPREAASAAPADAPPKEVNAANKGRRLRTRITGMIRKEVEANVAKTLLQVCKFVNTEQWEGRGVEGKRCSCKYLRDCRHFMSRVDSMSQTPSRRLGESRTSPTVSMHRDPLLLLTRQHSKKLRAQLAARSTNLTLPAVAESDAGESTRTNSLDSSGTGASSTSSTRGPPGMGLELKVHAPDDGGDRRASGMQPLSATPSSVSATPASAMSVSSTPYTATPVTSSTPLGSTGRAQALRPVVTLTSTSNSDAGSAAASSTSTPATLIASSSSSSSSDALPANTSKGWRATNARPLTAPAARASASGGRPVLTLKSAHVTYTYKPVRQPTLTDGTRGFHAEFRVRRQRELDVRRERAATAAALSAVGSTIAAAAPPDTAALLATLPPTSATATAALALAAAASAPAGSEFVFDSSRRSLPVKVLLHIFCALPLEDISRTVMHVCKDWYNITQMDLFWRYLTHYHFAHHPDVQRLRAHGNANAGRWRSIYRRLHVTTNNWRYGNYVQKTLEHRAPITFIKVHKRVVVCAARDECVHVWRTDGTLLDSMSCDEAITGIDLAGPYLVAGTESYLHSWIINEQDACVTKVMFEPFCCTDVCVAMPRRGNTLSSGGAGSTTSSTGSGVGASPATIFAGAPSGDIQVWVGERRATLKAHTGRVVDMQYNTRNLLVSVAEDQVVCVWSAVHLTLMYKFPSEVYCAPFAVTSRYLAFASAPTKLRVVRLSDQHTITRDIEREVQIVALRGGRVYVSVGKAVEERDIGSLDLVETYRRHKGSITVMRAGFGVVVTGAVDDCVRIIGTQAPRFFKRLRLHNDVVSDVHVTTKQVVAASFDGKVHVLYFGGNAPHE